MTNTYKLGIMIDYCKRYPDHVKALFDISNGDCCPIPRAGAIGEDTVLPTMSTYLPVVIVLATPYFKVKNQEPVLLTFTCGEDLSIRSTLGVPILMSMGPSTVDLSTKLMYMPTWSCGTLPVTVYKVHGPVQHGLSRIMPTAKTTAGTVPHAGTGTVPREVVPDW